LPCVESKREFQTTTRTSETPKGAVNLWSPKARDLPNAAVSAKSLCPNGTRSVLITIHENLSMKKCYKIARDLKVRFRELAEDATKTDKASVRRRPGNKDTKKPH
jgi:hypothetical protein